jgi:murein DD-endopeptidase MepM/ murein hydrolase activator NlpD
MKRFFALLIPLFAFVSCDLPERVELLIADAPLTPHERYAKVLRDAGLDDVALGREWLVAADTSLVDALAISLPLRETGYYDRSEARAVAWTFALRAGNRLRVEATQAGMDATVFLDLFEVTGDSAAPFRHRASALAPAMDSVPPVSVDSVAARDSLASVAYVIAHEARDSGRYVLRLQPELLRSGRFDITIRIEPILAFPVEGRGNGAVQSFFGADRDAGARTHHGIDIFAPRGTPALAATAGVVRSISPNNLGGNVVWLFDSERQQSLYYAHLDRVLVSAGQVVHSGDTVGLVGNSGNARTTKPHLHFGIYRRGRGPVDPWPWVRTVTRGPQAVRADLGNLGATALLKQSTTLYTAPDRASASRMVNDTMSVRVMGAAATWYRVQFADGVAGYVPATLVRGGL